MPFLLPNQQRQSTEGISLGLMYTKKIHRFLSSIKKDARKRKLVAFLLRRVTL